MERRTFIKASSLAGAGVLTGFGNDHAAAQGARPAREFYELRVYEMLSANHRTVLNDYLAKAAIPAWNRLGCSPVGVFTVVSGANSLSLYVVVPYPTLDSFLNASATLAADADYQKAAAPYLAATIDDPAYARFESTLLRAFELVPRLRMPAETAAKQSRLFELRMYESHSEAAAAKKIEMFNAGGEIALFDRLGLRGVFFGQTLIGRRQPNLVYMTVHADMAAREKVWDLFRNSPEWKKLSTDPQYLNTVSATTVTFLKPTDYSQI
jgi:hypothetical protein